MAVLTSSCIVVWCIEIYTESKYYSPRATVFSTSCACFSAKNFVDRGWLSLTSPLCPCFLARFTQSWQSMGCLLVIKTTFLRQELSWFGSIGYICWWNSVQPWWNWASAIFPLVDYPFLASFWQLTQLRRAIPLYLQYRSTSCCPSVTFVVHGVALSVKKVLDLLSTRLTHSGEGGEADANRQGQDN